LAATGRWAFGASTVYNHKCLYEDTNVCEVCNRKMKRKSISVELKSSYFKLNLQNHKAAVEENESVLTLF